jgi:hypothetical protein
MNIDQFDPNKKRLRDEQAAEAERVLKEAQDAEDKVQTVIYVKCQSSNDHILSEKSWKLSL